MDRLQGKQRSRGQIFSSASRSLRALTFLILLSLCALFLWKPALDGLRVIVGGGLGTGSTASAAFASPKVAAATSPRRSAAVESEKPSNSVEPEAGAATQSYWPDLVGVEGGEAVAKIKKDRPHLKVFAIPEGSLVTMDVSPPIERVATPTIHR